MTDLTPLFKQCVEIVSKELKPEVKPLPRGGRPPYFVSDTFLSECRGLYSNLVRLSTFISQVRPFYLQVNDEFSRIERSSAKELTLDEKNDLDEEFKLKIQKIYEKLKHLQAYEKKRSQIWESKSSKRGFLSSMFASVETDPEETYFTTLASQRMQVLRFLNEAASRVNTAFEKMQRKRFDRERQLNLLHFQNLDEGGDDALAFAEDIQSQYVFDVVEDEHENTTSKLTQEQVQELSSENKELLERKSNQFKQVEKLHHSMIDIVKLQTELTMHLETQAEQIDSLLDNQDQIDVDLRMGNRNLSKATNRNKRGSNFIITTCIILGLLLLLIDYIS